MQTLSKQQETLVRPHQRRFGWRLLGFALGALLAVGIAPKTGWLVRKQLTLETVPFQPNEAERFFGMRDSNGIVESPWESARRKETVARLNADVGVQAASAVVDSRHLDNADPDSSLNNARWYPLENTLEEIAQRFPNEPLPRAMALRYAMMDMGIRRPEGYWLNGSKAPPSPTALKIYPRVTTSVQEQMAQEGERLDPDNAYFPTMLAVLHFAVHSDAEGILEVRRAAVKPRWNDYTYEEVLASRRLREAAYGKQSALANLADADSLLLPHYAQVRELTRQIAWRAMTLENAGDIRGGVALRHAMMQIGVTLRDQSRNLIGSGTGRAVFADAGKRPGGKVVRNDSRNTPAQNQQHSLDLYAGFLRTHGQAAEANWVTQQCARDTLPQDMFSPTLFPAKKISKIWTVDLTLLAEIGLFAALAGILALLRYRRRFSVSPPSALPVANLWGLRMGVVFSVCLVLYGLARNAVVGFCLFGVGGLTVYAGFLWIIAPYVHVGNTRPLLVSLLKTVYALTGAACLLAACLAVACPYLFLVHWRFDLQSQSPALPGTGEMFSLFAASCALPLLTLLGLCLTSRLRRVPVSVGVFRDFGKAALPILAVLTLTYVGAVFATVRAEAETNARLARILEDAPGYLLSQETSVSLTPTASANRPDK